MQLKLKVGFDILENQMHKIPEEGWRIQWLKISISNNQDESNSKYNNDLQIDINSLNSS